MSIGAIPEIWRDESDSFLQLMKVHETLQMSIPRNKIEIYLTKWNILFLMDFFTPDSIWP